MNRFRSDAFQPLDEEERELMDSIERDEWTPVSNLAEEKEKAVQAARNTLNNTEYQFDYSKAKPNRFVGQQQEPILVALEPDVAAVFGTAEAVNRALRALIERISPALPDAI